MCLSLLHACSGSVTRFEKTEERDDGASERTGRLEESNEWNSHAAGMRGNSTAPNNHQDSYNARSTCSVRRRTMAWHEEWLQNTATKRDVNHMECILRGGRYCGHDLNGAVQCKTKESSTDPGREKGRQRWDCKAHLTLCRCKAGQ